jgi:16S rRNA (cytidine1402-2'-O)-methyltransferase
MSAKLFLVPTPIGNLEDITLRAIRVLKEVDLILAEDTRNAGILLKHLGIEKRLLSHHQHNEHHAVSEIIKMLNQGQNIALISDAGTPAISDPGYLLLREAIKAEIEIECLPGPTAFVPALLCSGLPCDRFYFEGFLPQKKGRKTRLEALAQMPHTVVLYESPHRIQKLVQEVMQYFGEDRLMSISREISKKFEEHIRGTAADILLKIEPHPLKGEIVVCIASTILKQRTTDDELEE